ncbi:aldehyde dehydrogenase family protein [Roseomonas sp. GC11]|uniref:aldehyde dehydrogenase family protein n=1 Tax=Roseomonas sp. GC11 TaxID=2950546 RepID=UPI00210992EE|nr:aldehyde dehydrogenase family protein [Roseomonas sp. GC11]MCQ4162297.1 aldehyde dehydrogenase family protein [Roseomonas sp. GC11]
MTPAEALAALRAETAPLSLARRRALLAALAAALLRRAPEIVRAIDADYGGRSEVETLLADVLLVVQAARRARRWLWWWSRPRLVLAPLPFQPALAWVEPVPKGVVGILAPWNYPVQLGLWPLAEALAAGNRVVLKPSEHTPRTATLLAELVAEALGPAVARVVPGDGAVAADFAAQPWDHLVFTGGTATGRAVMRAAAEHLTPLTLELGGQCPALVLPGADLARAARAILAGKAVNAGQTCVAPDTVLLVGHRAEDFAAACRAAAIPVESAVLPRHRARQAALATTGEALPGGLALVPEQPEEIFGPSLAVRAVADLEAAIAWVRARPAPLALYLFGAARAEAAAVAARCRAGAIVEERCLEHVAFPALPFGGVGGSGFGRYHGRAGFEGFSDWRARVRHGPFSLSRLFDAPRPPGRAALARRLLR